MAANQGPHLFHQKRIVSWHSAHLEVKPLHVPESLWEADVYRDQQPDRLKRGVGSGQHTLPRSSDRALRWFPSDNPSG